MSRGDMWGAPPPTGAYLAGPPPVRKTNGLAVASLVLSLLWVLWVGSILAVVFGFVALSQIRRSRGWQRGRTPAIIGVVAGFLGLAMLAVTIVGLAAYSGHKTGNAVRVSSGVTAPAGAGPGAARVSVTATGYTQTASAAGELISYGVILHNDSASLAALHVHLTVTLRDSRGRSLATRTVTITGIPAGGDFYVGGGAATNVSLKVSALRTAVKVGSSTARRLVLPPVTGASIKHGNYGSLGVAGSFRNPYNKLISSSATIYLVYLNSQGKIVGGDSEITGAAVRPGKTVSFIDPISSLSFVKGTRVEASVDPCSMLGFMPVPGNCPATP